MTEDEEAEEIVRRLRTPPPSLHNVDYDFGNGNFTVEMWFYKDKNTWEIKTKYTK